MYCTETIIRVRYGETDRMGYMYYGHYPEYFEVSRTDMIRSLGLSYREIEDSGIIMPVRSLKVDYKTPALYDELLTVKSCLKTLPEIKLDIDYEIYNEKKQLVCTGNTVLAFVDVKTRRPKRAPEFFLEAVRKYF
ncbi:MAG TPA: thioesterase family protein [Bacteroidales bacterium]|nr:thioesterase family protein [Bacteroidales bacterium]